MTSTRSQAREFPVPAHVAEVTSMPCPPSTAWSSWSPLGVDFAGVRCSASSDVDVDLLHATVRMERAVVQPSGSEPVTPRR